MIAQEEWSHGRFFGWRVVGAAFVIAIFSWGSGFYGPPVYLYAVEQSRGWSVGLVSSAVTTHFLFGAVVVANLPAIHRRFGIPLATAAGALSLALGVLGWAMAVEPWQLFAATLVSGAGWGATSGAAINAILAPWFQRRRVAALSFAYNGASVGGVIFQSLWIAAIGFLGFPGAAAAIGAAMVLVVGAIALRYLTKSPASLGQATDGDAPTTEAKPATADLYPPLPGSSLWRNWRFLSLAGATGISNFGQIGLIAHLVSILAPALGAQGAGICASIATVSAVAGRTVVGSLLPPDANRRTVVAVNNLVQVVGCLAFALSGGQSIILIGLGVLLVGLGIGNSTSLPPLIAQTDFARADVARVVALVTAISQACYAFAPAAFGLLRAHLEQGAPSSDQPVFFLTAGAILAFSAICYLLGRQKRPVVPSGALH